MSVRPTHARVTLVALLVAVATAVSLPAARAVAEPPPERSGAAAAALPAEPAVLPASRQVSAPLVPVDTSRLQRALTDKVQEPRVPTTPGIANSHDTRPVPWWMLALIGLTVLVVGGVPAAVTRLRRTPLGAPS